MIIIVRLGDFKMPGGKILFTSSGQTPELARLVG